ncbi:MAG TPA: hypothetical protein VF844_01390 [Ktedonobacteraceae bacterium]
MQHTDPSPIVGVFREQTKADHAIEELKQAGFTEDQITSRVVSLEAAPEEQTPENTRIIVTVKAEDRDKQAFSILFDSGANNADLPPGMELSDSNIVSVQAETVDLIPEPELEGSFSKDSFFAEEKEPSGSEEFGIMDNPNFPHG